MSHSTRWWGSTTGRRPTRRPESSPVTREISLEQAPVFLRARAHADQRPIGEVTRDVLSGMASYRDDPGASPEPDSS